MKKLFFATAALAAMISVSCVTEQPAAFDGEKVSITVKFAGASGTTRAVQDPGSESVPTVVDGYIYVLDASGKVLKAESFTGVTDPVEVDGGAKSFPATAQVYVIANVPANISKAAADLADMSEIEAATSAISYAGGYNTDYSKPAMANTGAAVTVDLDATDKTVATVTVPISPLYARVEIEGLEGSEWIKDFKLTNVYLDNYHSTFSMVGKGSELKSVGTDETALSGNFGDAVTMAAAANTINAGTGKVWAYHVGPGTLAHVIFKLSEYTAYPADGDGNPDTAGSTTTKNDVPTYLTVNKYDQSTITEFKRGYIYKINPVAFKKVGEASEKPNADAVQITATIDVKKWNVQDLDPVLIEDPAATTEP